MANQTSKFWLKIKQNKLHTTVVVFLAGTLTGGRVPIASILSITGCGKVAAVNAGDRVGLGYGPRKKCKRTKTTETFQIYDNFIV